MPQRSGPQIPEEKFGTRSRKNRKGMSYAGVAGSYYGRSVLAGTPIVQSEKDRWQILRCEPT